MYVHVCICLCVHLCVLSKQSTSKTRHHCEAFSERDTLLHKTHSKTFLVRRRYGLNNILSRIVELC